MDIAHYPYRFVQIVREPWDGPQGFLFHKLLFSFKSTKTHQAYWVWVEVYKYNFYAVKFHLKAHRDSPHRYNIMTGLNEPRQCIKTCMAIMDEVAQKDPLASFGFIGANMENETEIYTKRFRVYERYMTSYFDTKHFEHHVNYAKSAYLLVNRRQLEERPTLLDEIVEGFKELYPFSINIMKQELTIVKVGGAVVEDEAQLTQLLRDFIAIEGPKILVHGGGRRATKIAERLGIETKMVEGRRITDGPMLEVVTMVYGGLVNKHVVASLQALGADAIGLTGADGGIIRSVKRPLKNGIDYGFVGDVKQVKAAKIAHFIEGGMIPVIAPLTHDGEGNMLNTNADTMASETAKAMAKLYDVTLVYAFEKPGVLSTPDDDSSVIGTITHDDFLCLKADGTISGGMLPKIENALAAIDAGVKRVVITSAKAIDGRHGTVIM